MTKFMKEALLAGVVAVAFAGIAAAQGTLTDAEFKAQAGVNKATAKFIGAKTKCVSKCQQNAAKAVEPSGDCYGPSYGGATATCIFDPLKGAEAKSVAAMEKAGATDCPECYEGGDCNQEANDRTQNFEGQFDSFGPGIFCEAGDTADPAELKCELNTAKAFAKLVASDDKCYGKCFANARKGIGTAAACTPPASDPTLGGCINKADGKAVAAIDKLCVGAAKPDCSSPDDYPNGASWTNLFEVMIQGNVPGTFCGSPSGAFVE
jgi:hypothetical protein